MPAVDVGASHEEPGEETMGYDAFEFVWFYCAFLLHTCQVFQKNEGWT